MAATWGNDMANSWRTSGDIRDGWDSMVLSADRNDEWASYAGPGGWNDPNILEVGKGGMTLEEYRSHFTIWALAKAPLIIGCSIPNMSNDAFEILSNEVIVVNQVLWNRGSKKAPVTAFWSDISLDPTVAVKARDRWTYSRGRVEDTYYHDHDHDHNPDPRRDEIDSGGGARESPLFSITQQGSGKAKP
ncbi:Alpha-galactosidase [Hibiscus syriacus]|uniref:Alpha-galactosidase n=1 Tax=Hibiscus syriacus TaxID=106335 RepID=A0A6A3B809_HIBSY|nr:Alpha-galactosidase [Hibiscus syriacus]